MGLVEDREDPQHRLEDMRENLLEARRHPQTEEELADPQSSTLTKEPASKPLLPATLVLDG